jgi:hypothetical protein
VMIATAGESATRSKRRPIGSRAGRR